MDSRSAEASAITGFWQWWAASGAAEVAAAIAAREPGRVTGDVAAQVHAIHPDLAWETGSGAASEHMLVVTAAGDADLRATARRWLLAAPAPDATWSYADLRQPMPDPASGTLEIAGVSVDFARLVAGARAVGNHLDITIHHPAFAELPGEDRMQAVYLVLDAVVGEELVECWLGEIAASTLAPLDAFPAVHLGSFVRGFARDRLDDAGEPPWVLLQGRGPDGPVLALALATLSSVRTPLLDTHIAVDLTYAGRTDDGLPDPVALESLRAMEDRLCSMLGSAGRLVASETGAGRRRLHFYVEDAGPGAEVLAGSLPDWDDGAAITGPELDPGWGAVAHLRS